MKIGSRTEQWGIPQLRSAQKGTPQERQDIQRENKRKEDKKNITEIFGKGNLRMKDTELYR